MQRPAERKRYRSQIKVASLAVIWIAISLSGCHSANVYATVHNDTTTTISLIQVDYPSASFGTQSLAPGQDFRYRFKVLGSGQIKLSYTDISNKEHKSEGPVLDEGAEGTLEIAIASDAAHWDFRRTPKTQP